MQMLSRIKTSLTPRKQVRLRDDPKKIGDRTASTTIHTANKTSFNNIGTSGKVTNIAGHVIHGDLNVYNTDSTATPSSILINSPPSQPLAPDIWFGRDGIISSLAEIITGNENPRIAILGAGGMGKTATALHLIRHEAVVARYRDRAFFVACDAANSADLLASRILQIIGVSADAGENLVTAMHLALKGAPPTLLLLDNFESIWEAELNHSATRDLLHKIADSPSSTVIITMRATTPPPGIRWTFFESLPPLSASSAKEVFLAINATFCDGSNDGHRVLDELLRELDYIPLAIHLLAHVSTDLSPRFVLKQWQKQRTQMLRLDSYTKDKLESVDVSISLSMESLDIERNPGAIQLLGMLSLLPDGLFHWQERLDIIEDTFETATSDLFLLRQLALIYTASDKLSVLSTIRHFVLQHHPPDAQHVQCIYAIIWELVHTYAMVGFGPEFSGAVDALSPEMGNIGSLIDHNVAYDPGEIIVDIAIRISWHLNLTYPSSHLLQKVSSLVPLVHAAMQARYWSVSGEIMYKQDDYTDAASVFKQARDLFLETGHGLGAAQCSRRLGDILRVQSNYSEATTVLRDTRAQFLEIGDRLGAAQCSRSLGVTLRMQRNYSEATTTLMGARAQFLEIGNHLGDAECSASLGDILSSQGNYSEATTILADARAQFLQIGNRLGVAQCSQSLGEILEKRRNYSEATTTLTDARLQFIKIGDRTGGAECSASLGDILKSQGNYSEATAILTDARAQFIEIGNRDGTAECSASLGAILVSQRSYNEAEDLLAHVRDQFIEIGRDAWSAYCSALLEECVRARDDEEIIILKDTRAQFLEIGHGLGIAQCSQRLGEILRMRGNYSEATTLLTDARSQFLEIGDRLGAAQCSKSLGEILRKRSRYYEATVTLTDARGQFIQIGDRVGEAECLASLGDILRSQGNYSEATAILTVAQAQFIEIGNRDGDAECSASLGDILLRQRNYTEAENLLTHVRDQFIAIGRDAWVVYCSALLKECVRARDGEEIMEIGSSNLRVAVEVKARKIAMK
ncbi:TPR-like protein [Athelia psychrophila]|uniref:TPR-like protein n=1 Tax=Athelia psychrophila TaxID=1759441 RepID=A0A166SGV2_9AGAM|nr:TPR-like protein [Fibularhizoctonia sp. CBS 109695]